MRTHWHLCIARRPSLTSRVRCSYLSDCYPRYVASILAGNDFFRSCVGAAFPLFSTGGSLLILSSFIRLTILPPAFFDNLGVGPACSILGGISVLMIPIPFVLYVSSPRANPSTHSCIAGIVTARVSVNTASTLIKRPLCLFAEVQVVGFGIPLLA